MEEVEKEDVIEPEVTEEPAKEEAEKGAISKRDREDVANRLTAAPAIARSV